MTSFEYVSRRDALRAGVTATAALAGCATPRKTTDSRRPVSAGIEGAWPTYGADAARTWAMAEGTLPTKRRGGWSRAIAAGAPPVVADGRVFVAASGATSEEGGADGASGTTTPTPAGLYALGATDGQTEWSLPTGTSFVASPTVRDGTVYAVAANGVVYAFGAESGSLDWQRVAIKTTDQQTPANAAPTVAEDTLFVVDTTLRALATDDGSERWSAATKQPITGAPAVEGGVAVVPTGAGVVAFDSDTGRRRWRRTGSAVHTTPAIARDRVFVGGFDGDLVAFNLANGEPVWRAGLESVREQNEQSASGGVAISTPAVAEPDVYAVVDDTLVAVAIDDGSVRWELDLGSAPESETPLAVSGSTLYAADGEQVHLVERISGRKSLRIETSMATASPVPVDGVVFLGNEEGVAAVTPKVQ